jgi:hypothetical protein
MRLYSGQFGLISNEILSTLIKAELIDVSAENRMEAELDAVGVLREYSRVERDIARQAREMAVGEEQGNESRIKRRLAKEKGIKLGDEALEYIVSQIIEVFLQSTHIDEVFVDDRQLRSAITPIMRKYTRSRDEELDVEVRSKLRNLKEGSAAWDIEYEKAMERVKRTRGLDQA